MLSAPIKYCPPPHPADPIMTQGGLAVFQLATVHKFTQSLVFEFSLAGFFIFL
jgi:hypothetical protein